MGYELLKNWCEKKGLGLYVEEKTVDMEKTGPTAYYEMSVWLGRVYHQEDGFDRDAVADRLLRALALPNQREEFPQGSGPPASRHFPTARSPRH